MLVSKATSASYANILIRLWSWIEENIQVIEGL